MRLKKRTEELIGLAIIVVAFLVVVGGAVALVRYLAGAGDARMTTGRGSGGTMDASDQKDFRAHVSRFSALDAQTLSFTFQVFNEGGSAEAPDCTVQALGTPRGVVGREFASFRKEIAPGSSEVASGTLTVEDEGALAVRKVVVSC